LDAGTALTWLEGADIILQKGFCKEVKLPLYEYECTQCGQRIEKIQKFSDSPMTTCEKCGGKLEKLISSSAIQFKGSGWYVTDYAHKSSAVPSSSSSESGNGDKGPSTEGAKTEQSKKSPDKPAAGKES
jgi:putative FmdB family regulatory protein